METSKRATVYFDPEIHRALRMKAAISERSISDLVNEAVEVALAEDAEDFQAYEEHKGEPTLSFEEVILVIRIADRKDAYRKATKRRGGRTRRLEGES